MYEYIRIADTGETFNSLEEKCTEYGRNGWRVVAISDGNLYRYATLERVVPEVKPEKALKKINK